MNAYRNASYAGFILYLIGIVVIIYGLVNLSTEKNLDKNGLKAKGTVFDLEVIEPYRRAWVEFKTDRGVAVRFLDKLYWNHSFNKYARGQVVDVIYDPADPVKTATINDFFQRNTAPWWPCIVGAIVLFVGWIMRRTMLRKAKAFDAQAAG